MAAGQTILADGGPASLVGTVLAGVLKVSRSLPDGRLRIVCLLYRGDFFGQLFFPTMDFAIEAATDAEICVADRQVYEHALAGDPGLRHAMLLATSNALAVARERSFLLSSQTTLERVATYLLVMAARREQLLSGLELRSHKAVAGLMIARTDLASYLGTTIETISRHLHYLGDKGLVVMLDSSHFHLTDRDRLQSVAGVSTGDLRLFLPSNSSKQRPIGRPA